MSDKKRQVLPAGLWVVATPIGNLDDMTPRARQALEEAQAILCEDTRRTSQLLAALGISGKSLERLDAHATAAKIAKLVERLERGESLALVSDAGTPSVSDPGSVLVAEARKAGVTVTPVPGVSAVTALLSVCGFEATEFTFRGFFPRKRSEQESELELARGSRVSRVFVWFESPQRIAECVSTIAERAPDARVVAAKELTKIHERAFSGAAEEVREQVQAEISAEGERGEWCVAVCFSEPAEDQGDDQAWEKALQCLQEAGVPASEAARRVSQHFGIAKNTAYSRAIGQRNPRKS